jgi:hypothetical protein
MTVTALAHTAARLHAAAAPGDCPAAVNGTVRGLCAEYGLDFDRVIDRAQSNLIRKYLLETCPCPASSSPPATSWSAKKCG